MKKIFVSAIFAVILMCAPQVFAAGKAEPPSWADKDEYIVFKNDSVYDDGSWAMVEKIRSFAENGGTDAELDKEMRDFLSSCSGWYATFGMRFEGGLCAMKLAANEGGDVEYIAGHRLSDYFDMQRMREDDENRRLVSLWYTRSRMMVPRMDDPLFGERSEQTKYAAVARAIEEWGFSEAELYDTEVMKVLTDEDKEYIHGRIEAYFDRIHVTLDGGEVSFDDTLPEMVDGRTMVPMRRLAELMGAEVTWSNDDRSITVVRAGTTVVMHIDETTAYINDEPFEMGVAPYIRDIRTLIPARYISEFLGQRVEWIGDEREVRITEDKSLYESSNLEEWILPMGAVLTEINHGNPTIFPGYERASGDGIEYSRHSLAGMDVTSRSGLADKIRSLTMSGDNETFKFDAALWGSDYTKAIRDKWGDRGIMCWDLFRAANLIQWGYCAGYLSYNEALAMAEPAAKLVKENFSSWDEAYENYVDGYNWWSGKEELDTRSTERWERYREIRQKCADVYGTDIFNDNLFRAGVISPGANAETV